MEISVGGVEVHILSDGGLLMDGGTTFGIVPKVMWERIAPPDHLNRIPLGLNCLAIRSEGKTILVETGLGNKLSPKLQQNMGLSRESDLLQELAKIGIAPTDVDMVVNTHLHLDHCGWNTLRREDGTLVPTFPNAEYWLQREEWEDATHPNERSHAVYVQDDLLPLAEHDLIRFIDGDTKLTSAVSCLMTRGHTPAHQSVWVEANGQTALCTGDMAHHSVQLERLGWISAFDVLPLVSLETKRQIVQRLLARQTLILLVHGAYPGLGYLRPEGDKWRYEAVERPGE